MAMLAEPGSQAVYAIRGETYQLRRNQETSLMAKEIFGQATNESQAKLE